jgi:hypothetical protein
MFMTKKVALTYLGIRSNARDPEGSDGLRLWLPMIFGATAYLTLLASGNRLLNDSDIYWHIAVGQWIVEHRALPHGDPFSFTMHGKPWITSEWLSEILYLAAFKISGWTGPVIVAALSVATAFFLLTRLLLRTLPNIPVMILVGAAMVMTAPHLLARPHVLVFPLLVLWVNGIVQAAEDQCAPSIVYLPLIALWANLHGSFMLGLALIVPSALEALWTADKSARWTLGFQWLRFGLLSFGAACLTPYGLESILVTFRVFGLGDTLSTISEWRPQDFATLGAFEGCLLAGIAYALSSGFKLPPWRVAILVVLLHEALAHRRYVDVMGLAGPFYIARPLAQHLSQGAIPKATASIWRRLVPTTAVLVGVTCLVKATVDYTPPQTPVAAVEKIKELQLHRILNEYSFGGYLIYQNIPTFVDSRAELYGAAFLTRFQRAVTLGDVEDFASLLREYQIDATLLSPSSQAIGLLDRMGDWERIYADQVAVVHRYRGGPESRK